MSAATQKRNPADVQLPDVEKAAAIRQQLFSEVYFSKLAECGLEPRSQEEYDAYLRLADKALKIANHPAIKRAQLAASPVLRLEAELDQFMSANRLNKQASHDDAQINQLALQYASIPDVYSSMLSLRQPN